MYWAELTDNFIVFIRFILWNIRWLFKTLPPNGRVMCLGVRPETRKEMKLAVLFWGL